MNSQARNRRRLHSQRIVLILVLLAFAWRIEGLDRQSLWRDEIDAIYFALGDVWALLSMFIENGQNGALYFSSLRPWLRLTGSSEFALRYPSLLLGVLSIPLIWQLGRRLLPSPQHSAMIDPVASRQHRWRSYWPIFISQPEVLAAAFLAASPYQLWYSQEGKMYTATTLLALLAGWFWLQGVERPGRRGHWWGLFVVVSFGLYTHLLLALLLPLLGSWFLISYRRYRSRARRLLMILLAVIAVFAYHAPWIWRLLTSPAPPTGLPSISLPDALRETLRYQLNGFLLPKSGWWLSPLLILVAAGTLFGYRTWPVTVGKNSGRLTAWQCHLYVVSWMIVPFLGLQVLSFKLPVFAPRYIIWIAPGLMLALALGVQLLRPHRSRWRTRLASLLVVYVLGYSLAAGWRLKTTQLKFDLRSAVSYIEQRRRPEELLILHIPHLEYAYRYYSGDQGARPFDGSDARLGWWAGGLWTNHGLNELEAEVQVEQEMQTLTAGARDIWVMRSEVEMWDAADLMDQWLQGHSQLIERVTFNGTQAIHYRLQPADPADARRPAS